MEEKKEEKEKEGREKEREGKGREGRVKEIKEGKEREKEGERRKGKGSHSVLPQRMNDFSLSFVITCITCLTFWWHVYIMSQQLIT